MKRPEKVDMIRTILRQLAPDAEVILYGSEARGDAREDSDFDILILTIEPVTPELRNRITYPLFDLQWDKGIDVNPLVYSKTDWENRPFATPFYDNIIKEGIKL